MWVMDCGIPSEETLREMRDPAREIFYLVGTPKGKIRQYEKKLYEKKWLDLPWQKVRESMEVKRFEQEGELYGLAKSEGRQAGGGPGGIRGRHSSFIWTRKNSRNKKRNGVTDITCYAPT
jgi:hypothetical protein